MRPSRLPPQSSFAAALHRLLDRSFDALGVVFADDRPDKRVLIARVAHLERLDGRHKFVAKRIVHRFVNVNSLHADAALARLVVAAEDAALDGVVEIGVAIDDAGRVAAELQRDVLLAGPVAQLPADLGRAGEAELLDALVLDQGVGVARC